jgi:hypothetical protein
MPTVGLSPEVLNLLLYAGDQFVYTLEFADPETHAALDVSGYTFAAQIRTAQTAATSTATFSIDTTDADIGVIVVSLTPAQTAALCTPGGGAATKAYTWDLQRTAVDDADDVRTLFAGTVTVTLDRTRIGS